jgi:hypothetical protein
MLIYQEEIWDFRTLYDLCWGQAINVLDEIQEHDKEDELMEHLVEVYQGDIPSLTDINDYISYEWEEIYQAINMEENEDDDD